MKNSQTCKIYLAALSIYIEVVVCMLSTEDLKRAQKNLEGILAILCVLYDKFFIILLPGKKILFKLQAVICSPLDFVCIDG